MLPSIKTICAFIAIASLALAGCSSGDSGSNAFDKWQMNSYPQVAGNDISGTWLLINVSEFTGDSTSGSDIFLTEPFPQFKFRELLKISKTEEGYHFASCDARLPQAFFLDEKRVSSVIRYQGSDINLQFGDDNGSAVLTVISNPFELVDGGHSLFTVFPPFYLPNLDNGNQPPWIGRRFHLKRVASEITQYGTFSLNHQELIANGGIDCFRERQFEHGVDHEVRIEVAETSSGVVKHLSVYQYVEDIDRLERAGVLYQRVGSGPETAESDWYINTDIPEPYIELSIVDSKSDVDVSMLFFEPLAEVAIDFTW